LGSDSRHDVPRPSHRIGGTRNTHGDIHPIVIVIAHRLSGGIPTPSSERWRAFSHRPIPWANGISPEFTAQPAEAPRAHVGRLTSRRDFPTLHPVRLREQLAGRKSDTRNAGEDAAAGHSTRHSINLRAHSALTSTLRIRTFATRCQSALRRSLTFSGRFCGFMLMTGGFDEKPYR